MTGNNGTLVCTVTADRMGFMTGRTDKHGRRVHAAAVLSDKDGRAVTAVDQGSHPRLCVKEKRATHWLQALRIKWQQ